MGCPRHALVFCRLGPRASHFRDHPCSHVGGLVSAFEFLLAAEQLLGVMMTVLGFCRIVTALIGEKEVIGRIDLVARGLLQLKAESIVLYELGYAAVGAG